MNIENLDYPILQKADMIIIGVPVYYGRLDSDIVLFIQKIKNC